MPGIEVEDDALYAQPPDGFVAARDGLAKQLRAAGDRAGATRVRALRRPTRAAWAINATVRAQPDAAQELTDAAGLLGEAQRGLIAGGDPAGLRAAQTRVDAASDALIAAAPVSDPPTLEKIRQTLRAGTVDPDVLADVTSGRLLRERVASGFGGLGTFIPPPREAGGATRSTGASASAAARRAGRDAKLQAAKESEDRAAKEAEARAAERHARIQHAREQEADAEDAAEAARRALEEAESIMAARHEELAAAEARLAEAVQAREAAELE